MWHKFTNKSYYEFGHSKIILVDAVKFRLYKVSPSVPSEENNEKNKQENPGDEKVYLDRMLQSFSWILADDTLNYKDFVDEI